MDTSETLLSIHFTCYFEFPMKKKKDQTRHLGDLECMRKVTI